LALVATKIRLIKPQQLREILHGLDLMALSAGVAAVEIPALFSLVIQAAAVAVVANLVIVRLRLVALHKLGKEVQGAVHKAAAVQLLVVVVVLVLLVKLRQMEVLRVAMVAMV
jgi:hypothetical protein